MRWVAVVLVLAIPAPAHAEGDLANFLVGPVFGIVIAPKLGGVIGVEGGGGIGPERLNVGYAHRAGKGLFYAELDPWLYVGGTLGIGVEDDGKTLHPVLGAWEGLPVVGGIDFSRTPDMCRDWERTVTVAAGYRYTGVHELYVTIKAGAMHGTICID